MDLSAFDVPFDASLIAAYPVEPRDQARLLVVDRRTATFSHHRVAELPDLLNADDLVVVNDTKVIPSRLMGRKIDSGGKADFLFVRPLDDTLWEVIMKGRPRIGQRFQLAPDALVTVIQAGPGHAVVRIECPRPFRRVMEEVGEMPLPPYIKRPAEPADRRWYQTTFARAEGAVAAPTAGLHVTDSLRERLAERGVDWAAVTLHVGPGTFKPVTVSRIEEHRMDAERMSVPVETVRAIQRVRPRGGRVVAVGTTVVRALESSVDGSGAVMPGSKDTALYVTPGYQFRVVDAMVTNFHFPRTTLIMLVSAFGGLELIREAYHLAVKERYRLYSYGDAMLIM